MTSTIPPSTFLKVVASEITWELTGMEKRSWALSGVLSLSMCSIPEAEECYREGKHCADGNLLLRPAGAIEVKSKECEQ